MIKLNNKIFDAMLSLMVHEYNFYYEFLLQCNINEESRIPTMGIRATLRGFEILYNKEWTNTLSENQLCFVLVHETMHALSNHMRRMKERNHQLANISQDMIINSGIIEYFDPKLLEKPRKVELVIPEDFKEKRIFEVLYDWLIKNDRVKIVSIKIGTTDTHLEDEIPAELKEAMVSSFVEKQRAKGNVTGDIENMLGQLRPKKNNYLSHIKRNISNMIGRNKKSSWKRLSRRVDEDEEKLILKGYKKQKQKVNIGLDTSGSMSGLFNKVLAYVANNNIEINLIQCDTEVKSVNKINSIKQLQNIKIKGLGGTILEPMIKLIGDKFSQFPTILLTDGYTDTLDFSVLKKDILILTTEKKVDFVNSNHIQVKQIVVEKETD
jgi:predicted metal-dependent peptidase